MKRKTLLLLLITFPLWGLGGFSCSKDDSKDPTFQLPPETQTGANTFGVTINGKVYIPRDPTSWSTNPSSKGMTLWGATDFSWWEIEVKDGASAVGFKMIIHINDRLVNVQQIILNQSDFHDQYDSGHFTHIYFKIWDFNTSNYAYYGSIENQGVINITKVENGILSGNFSGKFVRYDNPNDFITISDGRFDINSNTLRNHHFHN